MQSCRVFSSMIMDRTAQFYSQPTYMQGGVMPVFAGSRRQRGGSVLGALKSFVMPILGRLGKRGAKAAMKMAKNVVDDVMTGKKVTTSLKQHGINAAKRFGKEVISDVVGQFGNQKSAPARRAAPSRKRAASTKARQSAKRRKGNF